MLLTCVHVRNIRQSFLFDFVASKNNVLMSGLHAKIDEGPRNVGALVGSNVQLKCLFHHRSCDDMQWTRINQQRETVSLYNLGRMFQSYGGRYSVNVSQRGECTLHINGLQLSDAGKFTCTELVPGAPQLRKLATITVIGMYDTMAHTLF